MAKRKTQNQNSEQLTFGDYELPEVSVRLVLNETSSLYSTTPIKTPEDAVKVMADLLRGLDREMVCVINMDNKLRPVSTLIPVNYHVVSIGDISSSMVPIANAFKTAIMQNAAACVLLHSHPSGDASPSQEDFDVTKRMVQAGKLLNIPVMDHIVVGAYQGETFSFRENYPDMFYAEPDLSVFPEIDPGKGWCAAEEKGSYEVSDKRQMPVSSGKNDFSRKSVIGRLSEKKEQVAVKDRAAPTHTKNEYSL